MGWDYFTYKAQPAFFIAEIFDCMNAEQTAKKINELKK